MADQTRPPTFGDMLRHARQARKLSLRQAAALISRESGQPISHTYLHAIEKGVRNPSLGMVQALACVYTLDEARLLSQAAHGLEIVRTYLQRRPDAAPSFLRLMLWAHRTNFAAWERLWRKSMADSDVRSGPSPIP
jgi:transcriptional regulator with XRE-family HTH domain